MSGHIGLVEVTGFDDPKVTEAIENLRKLRGKQREEAEKAKAGNTKGGQIPTAEKNAPATPPADKNPQPPAK